MPATLQRLEDALNLHAEGRRFFPVERAKCERVDCGEDDSHRDGNSKLLISCPVTPPMKATGTNTVQRTRAI
jgi:hypothetical protein